MCNKRAYLLENSKNILDNISVDDDLELVKSGNLMKAIRIMFVLDLLNGMMLMII